MVGTHHPFQNLNIIQHQEWTLTYAMYLDDSHTSTIIHRYIMQDLEHDEGFGRVVQERYEKLFFPIYSEHKTRH